MNWEKIRTLLEIIHDAAHLPTQFSGPISHAAYVELELELFEQITPPTIIKPLGDIDDSPSVK